MAHPKSHEDLESLKERQSRERFKFEEKQLISKRLQEAEELEQKRLHERKGAEIARLQEKEQLKLVRLREKQERKHKRQLTEPRICAKINVTQAVIDADEHQTFSADNQITVSYALTEQSQHVNISHKVPSPSKILRVCCAGPAMLM